jgi:hypothetical protein
MKSLSERTAQSAVEYLLLFASVSIVVFLALSPDSFVQTSLNESINKSLLEGTDIMAHCVCYDRETGDWCDPVCGDGCCYPGESCAQDCGGDAYHWQTFGWGECIPVCGNGERSRIVHCVDSDGNVVADHFCDASTNPTNTSGNTESCSNGPCNYYWREDGWGPCSAMCGPGTQEMTYECVRGYDGMVTYNSYCMDALGPPPDQTQACDLGQCCTCHYESACTDGSVPCCGMAGCDPMQHSEIQVCVPTGCINPAALQVQCTPHAECCEDEPGVCRESPCGWNERKYQRTCGDGSTSEVCKEDASCVLVCEGTDIVEHGALCPDDDWGLMTPDTFHTVDACTDGRKCEILCDTANNYYADGGTCVCQPPIFTEDDYVDTAKGAGGSKTYTSQLYDAELTFFVDVWSEDLIYDIRFYDESNNVIATYCCGPGWDSSDDIDTFSVTHVGYKVRVYVEEGGKKSSTSFGWSIQAQFNGCE